MEVKFTEILPHQVLDVFVGVVVVVVIVVEALAEGQVERVVAQEAEHRCGSFLIILYGDNHER